MFSDNGLLTLPFLPPLLRERGTSQAENKIGGKRWAGEGRMGDKFA